MAKSIKWSKRSEEIIGKRFGNLTVLNSLDERSKTGLILVRCQCECGNQINTTIRQLTTNKTKSCGCLRKINARTVLSNWNAENRKNLPDPRLISAKKIFECRYSDGDLSFDTFLHISQLRCVYCGKEAQKSNVFNAYAHDIKKAKIHYNIDRANQGEFRYNGLDRISSDFPHNQINVVPCCLICNRAKSNMSLREFAEWLAAISSNKEKWQAILAATQQLHDNDC